MESPAEIVFQLRAPPLPHSTRLGNVPHTPNHVRKRSTNYIGVASLVVREQEKGYHKLSELMALKINMFGIDHLQRS